MLFEELLVVVGIPLLLILVGFIASRAELVVIGGIGLLVAGVLIFASPLVVEYNTNFTSESSQVWEAHCNVTDLFPVVYTTYSDGVNVEQGTIVAGDITRTYYINMNYLQVKENGAAFNITWNFTNPIGTCPEHLHWVGRYQGVSNRGFDWYAYNWTSYTWIYVGTGSPDVVASAGDVSETLSEGCTPDFINATTNQIRIKMRAINAATSAYYIYTDMIRLDTEYSDTYSLQNQIVNCTHDSYNTTMTYDGVELEDNNNLILGTIIAFLGLLCLGIGAVTLKG